MTMPGFTAEASLQRGRLFSGAASSRQRPGRGVSPAQSVFTPYGAGWSGMGLRWPIMEPDCVRLCPPGWGGHCRWICF
jgi:hypothetical protein